MINDIKELNVSDNDEAKTMLFYDTETSGFRSGKKAFDDPTQAWVVQLAWILAKDGTVLETGNYIIDGIGKAEINHRAEDVHGISMERSIAEGVAEEIAVVAFLNTYAKSSALWCHNYMFDIEFLKDMIARNIDVPTAVSFGRTPHICTMNGTGIKEFCKLPWGKSKTRLKVPKLTELHKILFDEDFKDAHDAMADVKATMRCYYELVKRGILKDVA